MPLFDYRAKNMEGQETEGAVDAPSEDIAANILRQKNFIILSLKERKARQVFSISLGIFNRVKRKDVVIFARELEVMITANIPIVTALRILTKQTDNVSFKMIISEIADEVESGTKLSKVLSRYPRVFDNFFIYMIQSGETTGKLDEVLNYLADQEEKDYN